MSWREEERFWLGEDESELEMDRREEGLAGVRSGTRKARTLARGCERKPSDLRKLGWTRLAGRRSPLISEAVFFYHGALHR